MSEQKPDARKILGRRGEDLAAAFLRLKGFEVVAQNWRCRAGEIDLIVRRGREIRFVEVKSRKTLTYGFPEEAVTAVKLRHLQRAIETWLQAAPQLPPAYQADVVSILLKPDGSSQIDWIEGVL